jgi:hypothetical protein
MSESVDGPIDPAAASAFGELPEERVAHNEVVARRVNEAIEAGLVNRDSPTGFLCECGQLGCNTVIDLCLSEYEVVRSKGRQFVLIAGHEARLDRVIHRTPAYAIVCKDGMAGDIAIASDPRAED